MVHRICRIRPWVFLLGVPLVLPAGVTIAQQGPVTAMYADDQKRHQALALSFFRFEQPPTPTVSAPLYVYLSAGDLERAFDQPEFRPDAAIVPTNTTLEMAASSPATQQVLVERVNRQPDVMRDLDDQITARRQQRSAAGGGDLLEVGVDTFVAQLPRGATQKASGPFPKLVCFVATDFSKGGAVDRRELFTQDRVRKGIAGCLEAADRAGAQSLVMPLMGAASSGTASNDVMFEGQRVLKECRLMNSIAGIALGIHDFAPRRRSLRELGIVQWDEEIIGMFRVPPDSRQARSAQAAYRAYVPHIRSALRRGLEGQKTTANDADGRCAAIFNAQ